ncbi:LysR family transcriptional regulator [Elongatibacter sediminis]|uniref:LysR family transcriptional regulator n=1 Tax=Elongatibacter sediminis TaxID=3119006 RepID=A0AAW9RHM8_9GAMM
MAPLIEWRTCRILVAFSHGGVELEPLNDIAVFVEVVDSGSFTAAAERLALSRPVVSKYVSRLEARLGVRLLHRTTRRLSLTEAGQRYYDRCRAGLTRIAEAHDEVAQLQAAPRGTLRVNAPMSFGILHVAPALPEFLRQFPDVDIDLDLEDRKIDLVEEGYDVAIRIGELPDSALVARRLGPCRHVVCASPAYLERHGVPRHPDDLRQHRVISFRYQDSALDWLFTAPDGEEHRVHLTGRLRSNNSLALRAALLAGAGISRTPTFVVGDELRAGTLVPVLTGFRTLEVSINAVYPVRRYIPPKVRAFIDFMAERIADPPYWDST